MGTGGREHALARKLAASPTVTALVVPGLPGGPLRRMLPRSSSSSSPPRPPPPCPPPCPTPRLAPTAATVRPLGNWTAGRCDAKMIIAEPAATVDALVALAQKHAVRSRCRTRAWTSRAPLMLLPHALRTSD